VIAAGLDGGYAHRPTRSRPTTPRTSRLDGSGELRTFLTVALLMMRPGVVTIPLFQFVGIWTNFFLPLVMLSDPSSFPMTLTSTNGAPACPSSRTTTPS
jgi:ABC-type glycerol-3-phosphate transport system permease component